MATAEGAVSACVLDTTEPEEDAAVLDPAMAEPPPLLVEDGTCEVGLGADVTECGMYDAGVLCA